MRAHAATDVTIVGAGPAGCAAAITLQRAGWSVAVLDRARFPRDKICGDGLTTGGLRRLEGLGLDVRALPSFTPIDSISLRSARGRTVQIPLGDASGLFGAIVPRRELDAALVATVRAVGGRVEEGRAVIGASCEEKGAVELRLDDGAWSPLRRALAAPTAARVDPLVAEGWYAFRTYARDVSAEAGQHLWVWFARSLLPGYVWSFPLGERANIGICVKRSRHEAGSALRRAFDEVLASPFLSSLLGPRAVLDAPVKAWPIPSTLAPGDLVAADGRVVFIGDAARAADPFTGEGIGQALESGTAAAEALLAGAPDPTAVAATYRDTLAAGLGRDHRLSALASAAMSHPAVAEATVSAFAVSTELGRLAGRWLFEDYPRALVVSPRSWHRGALATTGAYRAD